MIEGFSYKLPEKKEIEQQNPYVVSEDIGILMQKWAKNKGFVIPDTIFFVKLRLQFAAFMKQIFSNFELVSEEELSVGLKNMVKKTELFPISLDRVYYQSNPGLDISRLVDAQGNDRGLGRRRDSSTLLNQFRKLRKLGIKEAVLVDDVIFSGGLAERITNVLSSIGIETPIICSGIAIKEGVDIITRSGKELCAVKTYDKVTDEVCERDFYPGVPLCGRTLNGSENVGIPYILPFGNPEQWASIPKERQTSLSKFCLRQSISIFETIEEMSGRYVNCEDLDRKIIHLPKDKTRFVNSLKQLLQQI